jgi:hypothetical protein
LLFKNSDLILFHSEIMIAIQILNREIMCIIRNHNDQWYDSVALALEGQNVLDVVLDVRGLGDQFERDPDFDALSIKIQY